MNLPRLTAPVCAAALAVVTLPAVGQNPAANEEIVTLSPFAVNSTQDTGYRATNTIGGTKIDTPLRDVPMSIQVVTSELIRDIGAIDGTDLLKYQAGVEVRSRDGADDASFRIRGYNVFWQYREGFRRYDINDGVNIDRVEVVAGPAAVFYGFSQPGGIINTYNKRPLDRNFAELRYLYGSWNFNRVELDANLALNDRVAFRFNTSYTYQDDSWRDFEFLDRKVFAPVVQFRLTDRTTLTLDYEYLKQDRGFTHNKVQDAAIDPVTGNRTPLNRFLDVPASRQWSGPDAEHSNEISNLIAILDHQFNDWLAVNTAVNLYDRTQLRHSQINRGLQVDALRDGNGQLVRDGQGNAIKAIRTWWNDDDNANTVYNVRADFLASFDVGAVENKLLFGANHTFDINTRTEAREGDSATSTALRRFRYYPVGDVDPDLSLYNNEVFGNPLYLGPSLGYRDTQEFNSIYLNHSASAFDGMLHTLAGIRFDDFTYNRARTANGQGIVRDQTQDKWSPQLGAVFRPIPSLSFYALTNTSLEVPPVQTNSIGEVLPNREGKSIEGGVKYELMDGRLSGSLSLFEIRNTNIAVSDPNVPRKLDGLPGENVTVGEQTTEGFDFTVFYSPVDGYSLIAGWSYVDTYISKDTNPARVGQTFDILPYNRATFWNRYEFTDGAADGLGLGFGFRWTDEMDRGGGASWRVNPADPTSRIIKNDAYFVWDAAFTYRTRFAGHDTDLALHVFNVFDQEDQGGGLWIEPRNIRFTVGMRF